MNKKNKIGYNENKSQIDNIVKDYNNKANISVKVSSAIDYVNNALNVLTDDDKEWVSNGDHKNAWIRLSFKNRKVNKIIIADRKSTDYSMVSGKIIVFSNNEIVKEIDVNLNGDGTSSELFLGHNVYADSILFKAGERVWGKNVGLRVFRCS